MEKIAILLTVHNRKDMTLMCIKQIYAQEYDRSLFGLDVFLTDDGSTDGTADAVNNQFPDVKVIYANGSLFWNRGMYLAWDKASRTYDYDYYLWLNDDTNIYDNCILRLFNSSIDHEDKCIIVGSTCWVNDKARLSYGGYRHRKLLLSIADEQECETFNGNIVLVPKYVYKKVGNLDYNYHHSCGDFDYGYRASKLGIDIYVAKGLYGECDRHTKMKKCFDSSVSLNERWKAFNFNHQASDNFLMFSKYQGFLYAIIRISTSFVHMLIPRLYDKIFGINHL